MKAFLPLFILLVSFTTQAAKTKVVTASTAAPEVGNYTWMTDAEYKEGKALAKTRSERTLASANEVNEQLMSREAKDMRNQFLKITSAQELKAMILKMNENYATSPDDLKLMTAMLTPLLKFKAFTYKLYPFLSKEKITQSILVSQVQGFASFMSSNLPSSQWRAGFDLVTHPADEDDLVRFDSASDVQNYFVKEVYPSYIKAGQRIQALNFSKHAVVWDNKIFFGTDSFSDNLSRYQLVGEGERLLILANVHSALADICKFSSYNIDELLPMIKETSQLFGFDSLFSDVDGVNARKVAAVYRKPRYASLFTIRAHGATTMNAAFNHVKESARNLSLAWVELKDRNDNNQAFIRAAIFAPFTQTNDNQIEGMENVLTGRASVRSDVSGEVLTVDLPAFYANPPKDLKSMLPTAFDNSELWTNNVIKAKDGSSKNVKSRNYFAGRATNWNLAAYKTLLPDLKSGNEVAHAMKILNQSISGAMPGMIMQPFMMY